MMPKKPQDADKMRREMEDMMRQGMKPNEAMQRTMERDKANMPKRDMPKQGGSKKGK